MMDHFNLNSQNVAEMKARGGVPIDIFKDFVINGEVTYSVKHLRSFLKSKLLASHMRGKCGRPGKVVLDFVN
jgi:hypothetical protein